MNAIQIGGFYESFLIYSLDTYNNKNDRDKIRKVK